MDEESARPGRDRSRGNTRGRSCVVSGILDSMGPILTNVSTFILRRVKNISTKIIYLIKALNNVLLFLLNLNSKIL